MQLISTWTCFWLLLKLSLIGNVSSLSCYNCDDEDSCKDDKKPFESVQCTSPVATCTIVLAKYARGAPNRLRVTYRGCAHPEWIQELGGAVDYCKKNDNGNMEAAGTWLNGHPDKMVGGKGTFHTKNSLAFEVCTCTGEDNCNEDMGKPGKHYPVPADEANKNNGNNDCDNVCDSSSKQKKCERSLRK